MLADLLEGVDKAIKSSRTSKLQWLSEGLLQKCICAFNPYELPDKPINVVKGDAVFRRYEAELAQISASMEPLTQELQEKKEQLGAAHTAVQEALKEWHSESKRHAGLEIELHDLEAKYARFSAHYQFNSAVLQSAKEANMAPPPPRTPKSVPTAGAGASSASGTGASLDIEPGDVVRFKDDQSKAISAPMLSVFSRSKEVSQAGYTGGIGATVGATYSVENVFPGMLKPPGRDPKAVTLVGIRLIDPDQADPETGVALLSFLEVVPEPSPAAASSGTELDEEGMAEADMDFFDSI
jgi:hypothetical protein